MIRTSVSVRLDNLYKTLEGLKPQLVSELNNHSWSISNKLRMLMKKEIYTRLYKRTGLMGSNIFPYKQVLGNTFLIGLSFDDDRVPWYRTHLYNGGPLDTVINTKTAQNLTIPLSFGPAYFKGPGGKHKVARDFPNLFPIKHGNVYTYLAIAKGKGKRRTIELVFKLQKQVTINKRVDLVHMESVFTPYVQAEYQQIYNRVISKYLKRTT